MLSLSHSLGYAIRALSCLVSGECESAFVRDLAKCADVPPAYLAKLFTRLVDAGILESKRGWKGGTRLARPAQEISLLEIAEVIEPKEWLGSCLMGLGTCHPSNYQCPTHAFWAEERARIKEKLASLTLQDVIDDNGHFSSGQATPYLTSSS